MRAAQLEIVLAMVGRHVDEAGALVGGDEVAGQERARLGEEAAELVHRVAGDGAGEVGAFACANGSSIDAFAASVTFVCSDARQKPSPARPE